MASLKPLIREVMDLTCAALAELNFRKRSGDLYTYELGGESLGWLAFVRVTVRDRGIQLMPNVGVRNQRIEQISAAGSKRYYIRTMAVFVKATLFLSPWSFPENRNRRVPTSQSTPVHSETTQPRKIIASLPVIF